MTTRTALITGGARRIGAQVARTLHACDMNVIIHYHRSGSEAAALVEELNAGRDGSASLLHADLSDDSTYGPLIREAEAVNGGLDVLVNNASAFYPTPVGATTPGQWHEIVDTNLKAPYFLCQQAAEGLQRSRGCIVNISDIHGSRPLKTYPVYSIAKAGLIMLTKALAKELAPAVRVNAVAPGAVAWPEDMREDVKQRIVDHTMLKRPGSPADVAAAVRYLVLDAGYVTGSVITVDGGRLLYS